MLWHDPDPLQFTLHTGMGQRPVTGHVINMTGDLPRYMNPGQTCFDGRGPDPGPREASQSGVSATGRGHLRWSVW